MIKVMKIVMGVVEIQKSKLFRTEVYECPKRAYVTLHSKLAEALFDRLTTVLLGLQGDDVSKVVL